MTLQLTTPVRSAMMDAISSEAGNAGKLKIYTGPPPANANLPATGILLSTHTLESPFAPAASGGVLSPTLPADATAVASGTAGYFRVTKSDDTVIGQGTVGEEDDDPTPDCILNDTDTIAGFPVRVLAWAWTAGAQ